MSKTTNIRVRLASQNHPSGQRLRAGIKVTNEPTSVEVTEEQLASLQADPYIQILKAAKATTPAVVVEPPKDEENKAINLSKANKVTLIKILIDELGQTPEKDFDPNASNKVLENLIISLREVKALESGDMNGQDDDDDGSQDDDDNDE